MGYLLKGKLLILKFSVKISMGIIYSSLVKLGDGRCIANGKLVNSPASYGSSPFSCVSRLVPFPTGFVALIYGMLRSFTVLTPCSTSFVTLCYRYNGA